MTQKEYKVLATINQEGLDNTVWGMSSNELDTDFYGCTFNNRLEKLPPHIYIWGNDDEIYSNAMHELLYSGFDKKIVNPYADGEFICFFWLNK